MKTKSHKTWNFITKPNIYVWERDKCHKFKFSRHTISKYIKSHSLVFRWHIINKWMAKYKSLLIYMVFDVITIFGDVNQRIVILFLDVEQ